MRQKRLIDQAREKEWGGDGVIVKRRDRLREREQRKSQTKGKAEIELRKERRKTKGDTEREREWKTERKCEYYHCLQRD